MDAPQAAQEAPAQTIDPQVPATRPERVLAPLQAHGEDMAIMPRSIEEAQRYANGLITADIVPDAFRMNGKNSPANAPLVLMGILKSLEIHVPPQTGLAGLLPLNGRFSVWGDLAAALVQRTGKVAKQTALHIGPAFDPAAPLGEWPEEFGWEVRYWRKGQDEPYIGRFTVRDAKRAGLWMNQRKQPWVLYPDRMLFNRARAFPLRDGFADGLHGLSIAEEVMDALPSVEEERAVETKRLSALTDDEPITNEEDVAA